jgi:hypothetical protein
MFEITGRQKRGFLTGRLIDGLATFVLRFSQEITCRTTDALKV